MKLLAATLVSLAAALALPAAHAGTLEDIGKRGAIRLGYSETKAPFSFKARDDGQPAGFAVELCKRVALAAVQSLKLPTVQVEWVALDPSTRIDAVAEGKVDIECSTTTPTLSRREKVDFSIPFFADAATLMGRSEKAIAGDRTALVGTFLIGGGGEGFAVFAEDLSYEPYSLVVRKGDDRFRLLVDSVLARLCHSDGIDALYAQWLLPLGKPSPALATLYLLNALPE